MILQEISDLTQNLVGTKIQATKSSLLACIKLIKTSTMRLKQSLNNLVKRLRIEITN